MTSKHNHNGPSRRHTRCHTMHHQAGFSLIELLMALCVVAILGAIAFPAYTSYLARGLRAEARAQLQLAAQYMHRFQAANDSFSVDRAGKHVGELMPRQLMQSPAQGQPVYTIEFAEGKSTASATEFRLVMSPVKGGRMASDECGGFALDSYGRRGVTGVSARRDACWR